MTQNVSKLRDDMLNRKAKKFARMVEDNFAQQTNPPRLTLIVTPGLQKWPKLSKEILDKVEAPNNNWVHLPLFVNIGADRLHVEFVLVTKNTLDAWDKWENIVTTQYNEMRNKKLNSYQIGILYHMLNNTDNFKQGLEQLGGVPMPDKPILNNMRTVMTASLTSKTGEKVK